MSNLDNNSDKWISVLETLPIDWRFVLGWYPSEDPNGINTVFRSEGRWWGINLCNSRFGNGDCAAPLYWRYLPSGPNGEDVYAPHPAIAERATAWIKAEALVAAIVKAEGDGVGVEKREFGSVLSPDTDWKEIETICLSLPDYLHIRRNHFVSLTGVNDTKSERGELFGANDGASGTPGQIPCPIRCHLTAFIYRQSLGHGQFDHVHDDQDVPIVHLQVLDPLINHEVEDRAIECLHDLNARIVIPAEYQIGN